MTTMTPTMDLKDQETRMALDAGTCTDNSCLVWDFSGTTGGGTTCTSTQEDHRDVRIYLGTTIDTSTSTSTTAPEVVESSMLQYQRQVRKNQAAKKAGAHLTNAQLDLVYEDDAIAVVNKPAGVLCVPGIRNNDSIANLVLARQQQQQQQQLQVQDDICQDACSMAVHRLDMDTSGLVVFGKTKTAVSTLHQLFRRESNNDNQHQKKKKKKKNNNNIITGTVIKEYEALVCGHLPSCVKSGYIDLPLQKDVHHPPFMRVSTPHSEALARTAVDALRDRNWTNLTKRNPKPSQTTFRVLSREYLSAAPSSAAEAQQEAELPIQIPVTRLALTPITGRTHQLRVHCAAMGFPIVGDPVYGLYGESAFGAGLFYNPIQIITSSSSLTESTTNTTTTDTNIWRAPLAIQKQRLQVYPLQQEQNHMCLHAKKLGFPHPMTGQIVQWQVSPKF